MPGTYGTFDRETGCFAAPRRAAWRTPTGDTPFGGQCHHRAHLLRPLKKGRGFVPSLVLAERVAIARLRSMPSPGRNRS